ncbi:MAG: hypothetical protein HUJ68_10660, partial [Clostridia bacterium]|nr:hypothetical protein [Clostridia bacterium]
MKFDCIIMNPPYDGSLHLKILEHALKFKKDDGILVNLSPVSWLHSPKLYYTNDINKFSRIIKPLSKLEIIEAKKATAFFNTAIGNDLGIYVYDNKTNLNIKCKQIILDIMHKVYNDKFVSLMDALKYDNKEYELVIPHIHGNIGNKDFYEVMPNRYEVALKGSGWGEIKLSFNTEKERRNFYDSCFCNFYKNLMAFSKRTISVPRSFLPYMNDYSKVWTDEDYCKYFNLTKEESEFMCREVEDYRVKDFIEYEE